MKRILSIFFCVILLFSSIGFSSYAANETFTPVVGGYRYEGDLPSGFHFYAKDSDGHAFPVLSTNVILNVVNRMGVAIKTGSVGGFVSSVISDITSKSTAGAGFVYNSLGAVVGVALTDISNCDLVNASLNGGTFTVTSDIANIIHDIMSDNLSNLQPDYINIGTFSENLMKPRVLSFYNTAGSVGLYYDSAIAYVENPTYTYNFGAYYNSADDDIRIDSYLYTSGGARETFLSFGSNSTFISDSSGGYADICNFYGLSDKKNVISINDIMSEGWQYNGYFCDIVVYDSNFNLGTCHKISLHDYDSGFSDTVNNSYSIGVTGGNLQVFSNVGWITIYKNLNVVQAINNNTYEPDYRVSNTFNEYNSSSTNTYDITYNTNNSTDIDNAQTNNTNIYNTTNQEINNNTTNNNNTYNTDNSTTIINNIVNNYYGTSPSPSPSPDPGGDDDDPIWEALLQAIVSFFTKVGQFLGAVLTGILGLLSSILDSLSEITSDFGGLTDFISSFFSVLPAEIVVPITTGITLMVVICLLKALK